MSNRKKEYLSEQTAIAAPFIDKGGSSKELGLARIVEAERVVGLPDEQFEDYVEGWIPVDKY